MHACTHDFPARDQPLFAQSKEGVKGGSGEPEARQSIIPTSSMHGVKRVREAAVIAAKKAADAKRITALQHLWASMVAKRKAGDKGKDALMVTERILELSSSNYTVWNYRKEILLALVVSKGDDDHNVDGDGDADGATSGHDECLKLWGRELALVQRCLMSNPKTYAIWNHRQWVIEHLGTHANLEKELTLCGLMLSADERNFHCWNYRRWLANRARESVHDTLAFTMLKVEQNFSNYSAWHQRSVSLPVLIATGAVDATTVLTDELELVKQAFFTEPADQSAWFYHRWLLGHFEATDAIVAAELHMINELLEMEPDAKWALLTSVQLMLHLWPRQPPLQREEHVTLVQQRLTQLCQLDSDHALYYDHLRQRLQQLKESDAKETS